MEIKMMLSMPSTISKKQSVSRASQVSALRKSSIDVKGSGFIPIRIGFKGSN
jgi:hypothetical protein